MLIKKHKTDMVVCQSNIFNSSNLLPKFEQISFEIISKEDKIIVLKNKISER